MRVAFGFEDPGLEIQLTDTLERIGCHVVSGASSPTQYDCLILLDDRQMVSAIHENRQTRPIPGLVVMCQTQNAMDTALDLRAEVIHPGSSPQEINKALTVAHTLRHSFALIPIVAADALGLPADAQAPQVLQYYPNAPQELINEIVETFQGYYVTLRDGVAPKLGIREQELLKRTNGAYSFARLIQSSKESQRYMRLIWALACCELAGLSPMPLNRDTPIRCGTAIVLLHMEKRLQRLENSTHYDVLEIAPTADNAIIMRSANSLAHRFHPDFLRRFDLGPYSPHIDALWKHILQARTVLLDPVERANYNDWLAAHRSQLTSEWLDIPAMQKARAAYQAGQEAMKAGQLAKAMNQFSLAARGQPGTPLYECYLSLARYQVKVAQSPGSSADVAAQEIQELEGMVAGRRPDPLALVPLAMLFFYAGDKQSASWYVSEALRIAPQLQAAQQLRARLT